MNKAELLEKFSQHLDDIENLKNSEDFYQLESSFDEIITGFSNEVLSSLLKSKSKDRRKKSQLEPSLEKLK